jgi:hypothetical protein
MNLGIIRGVTFREIERSVAAILTAASLRPWALAMSPDVRPVAIVDDDKWVLKSLERLVKSAGFSVETFLSAEEFLSSRLGQPEQSPSLASL